MRMMASNLSSDIDARIGVSVPVTLENTLSASADETGMTASSDSSLWMVGNVAGLH